MTRTQLGLGLICCVLLVASGLYGLLTIKDARGAVCVTVTHNDPLGVELKGDASVTLKPGGIDVQTPTAASKAFHITPVSTPSSPATKLKHITDLDIVVKQVVPGSIVLPSYQLQINPNPTDLTKPQFTTLVFEPYVQGYEPQPTDGFKLYDADEAPMKWWSSKPLATDLLISGGGQANPQPWSVIRSTYPDAIVLGYGWNLGSGNAGSRAVVAGLKFSTTGTCVRHTWTKPKPVSPSPSQSATSTPSTSSSPSTSGSASPSATSTSASPTATKTTPPTTATATPSDTTPPVAVPDEDDPTLPVTGAGLSELLMGAGIVLFIGTGAVLLTRRRRKGDQAHP